jgi:hypothetical protein
MLKSREHLKMIPESGLKCRLCGSLFTAFAGRSYKFYLPPKKIDENSKIGNLSSFSDLSPYIG